MFLRSWSDCKKKIKKHVAKGISLKICLLKTIVCFKQICLLFIFRIPTCLVYSTSPLSSPKTTSFMELQDKDIFWKFFGGLPTDSNPLNSKKRIQKRTYSPNGGSKCTNSMVESIKTSPTMPTKQTRSSEDQSVSSWWLNQPSWKIWSSNWIISPGFGVKTKNVLETTP